MAISFSILSVWISTIPVHELELFDPTRSIKGPANPRELSMGLISARNTPFDTIQDGGLAEVCTL